MSYMLCELPRTFDSQPISQAIFGERGAVKRGWGNLARNYRGFCRKWDVWSDLRENKKCEQGYVSKSIQQTNLMARCG